MPASALAPPADQLTKTQDLYRIRTHQLAKRLDVEHAKAESGQWVWDSSNGAWSVFEFSARVGSSKRSRRQYGFAAFSGAREDPGVVQLYDSAEARSAAGAQWAEDHEQTLDGHAPTLINSLARLPVFKASRRPATRQGTRTVSIAADGHEIGWVEVSGRLGQAHADILAAMVYVGAVERVSDGGALVTARLADIERVSDLHSHEQLHLLLEELRDARLHLHVAATRAQGEKDIEGQIVDHIATLKEPTPAAGSRVPAVTYCIRLGVVYTYLWGHDLSQRLDPAPVAALRSGMSQAIARYLRTQSPREAGWKLDTLIRIVTAGVCEGDARRNARRAVRGDATGLAKLGIEVEGDRVFRRSNSAGSGPGQNPDPVGQTPGDEE